MQQRSSFIPIVIFFLILAGGIWFSSSKGWFSPITGLFEQGLLPVQRMGFGMGKPEEKMSDATLHTENTRLLTELAKQKQIEKENKALRDQFETTKPSAQHLLPAMIIGLSNNRIIIDKGKAEGVAQGDIVVFKDNLIGRIDQTSVHRSVIVPVTDTKTSLTVRTSKTNALGVVQGKGSELLLDNVVLADKLEKNDTVVTKGDEDIHGQGYPPGLIVGKIISISKKASDLFQQAEVRSLVDIDKLEMVFILSKF